MQSAAEYLANATIDRGDWTIRRDAIFDSIVDQLSDLMVADLAYQTRTRGVGRTAGTREAVINLKALLADLPTATSSAFMRKQRES